MLFGALKATFKRKRALVKGGDTKKFFTHARVRMPDEDTAVIDVNNFVYDDSLKTWKETVEPFAVLKSDDTLTLVADIPTNSTSLKLLWRKFAGGGRAQNVSNEGYVHTVRFVGRMPATGTRFNLPLTKGFTMNTRTWEIVWHAEDKKATVNRAKSKDIYEHVRKVGDVMDILYKLGALDEHKIYRWPSSDAIKNVAVTVGCSEDTADQAIAAFRYGWGNCKSPPYSRRVEAMTRPGTYLYEPIPEAERAAMKFPNAKRLGLQHLRKKLQLANDGMDFTTLKQPPTPHQPSQPKE